MTYWCSFGEPQVLLEQVSPKSPVKSRQTERMWLTLSCVRSTNRHFDNDLDNKRPSSIPLLSLLLCLPVSFSGTLSTRREE
jgi:hypothetical protein